MRSGRENDSSFGTRMSGVGNFAGLIEKRFDIACRRFNLNGHGSGRKPPDLVCKDKDADSAAKDAEFAGRETG